MHFSSATYSAAAKSFVALRNIRKVKLFPRVRSVTLVTYFKDTADRENTHFIGKAHTINFWTQDTMTIELEHNSHLPPPVVSEDEEKEEEIKEDNEESEPFTTPAYGCHYLPA